jgi:hypothetical protein
MLLILLQSMSSDPFAPVELYAFRAALFILFIVGLYKLLKHEIKR